MFNLVLQHDVTYSEEIAKVEPRSYGKLTKDTHSSPSWSIANFCSPCATLITFGSADYFGIFVLQNAYRSSFVGFFLDRNDQYLKWKFWPWMKTCDIYTFIVLRDARDF